MTNDGYRNHVGYRFMRWGMDKESGLTPAQKAHAYDQFAAEFDAMPPGQQPHEGWAETMAYLCRRAACRHRGEPVEEWKPAQKRAATSRQPSNSSSAGRRPGTVGRDPSN